MNNILYASPKKIKEKVGKKICLIFKGVFFPHMLAFFPHNYSIFPPRLKIDRIFSPALGIYAEKKTSPEDSKWRKNKRSYLPEQFFCPKSDSHLLIWCGIMVSWICLHRMFALREGNTILWHWGHLGNDEISRGAVLAQLRLEGLVDEAANEPQEGRHADAGRLLGKKKVYQPTEEWGDGTAFREEKIWWFPKMRGKACKGLKNLRHHSSEDKKWGTKRKQGNPTPLWRRV